MVSRISVRETDVALFELLEALVGNGDAVGIGGKVFENSLRSCKGRFTVDNPGGFTTAVKQCFKVLVCSEWFQISLKPKLLLSIRTFEIRNKLSPKEFLQHFYRGKKALSFT